MQCRLGAWFVLVGDSYLQTFFSFIGQDWEYVSTSIRNILFQQLYWQRLCISASVRVH